MRSPRNPPAGGIKLKRLLIVRDIVRSLRLRAQTSERSIIRGLRKHDDGKSVDYEHTAIGIVALFVALIFLSWLGMLIIGYEPLPALFEVTSACATVGLSTGLGGAELTTGAKLILSLDMLMGRVEILALLFIFLPGTWVGKRRKLA